jgi:hypothetical protein
VPLLPKLDRSLTLYVAAADAVKDTDTTIFLLPPAVMGNFLLTGTSIWLAEIVPSPCNVTVLGIQAFMYMLPLERSYT